MPNRVREELVRMIDRALGDQPKEALIAARQLQDDVEWLIERCVALARREGYDWGRISRLLRISRQWARVRFKNAPPRVPPHVVALNRYLREERESQRLVNELREKAKHGDDGNDVVAW